MNLRGIDTNLLVILDALLEQRSVSRAAQRLGLTPSAVSHALGRLRDLFGDELLVRAGRSMAPTARAETLQPRLRTLMEDLQGLLASDDVDPATLRRTFRLVASDHFERLILGPLSARLAQSAPDAGLHVRYVSTDKTARLRDGSVDLVVGRWTAPPADLLVEPLLTDGFVTLLREGHPAAAPEGPLDLDDFLALDHILVAPLGGSTGIVDDALARLGRERRITRIVPGHTSAPHLAAASDLAVTLSWRIAAPACALGGLVMCRPPAELELQPYSVDLGWHRRADNDPAHRWLRRQLHEVAAELPPLPAELSPPGA